MRFTPDDIINAIDPDRHPDGSWKDSVTLGICTLFWQQTPDEIATKSTIYKNAKGFNSHDAAKGVKMAKYAMQGENTRRLPDEVMQDAYNMVYKYRRQLADILNKKEEREMAYKELNMTESISKNDKSLDKKLNDLKAVQKLTRNDRIQNMKTGKIHVPATAYKRNKKVSPDD